jgi:hypothetical protein
MFRDKKCELFPNLIKMLEFDRNNMLYSYILQVLRKNKIAKAEEGANKVINIISNFVVISVKKCNGFSSIELG